MLRFASIAFIQAKENQQIRVLKLQEPIKVFPSASNSAILSLAAFLVWKYPTLIP